VSNPRGAKIATIACALADVRNSPAASARHLRVRAERYNLLAKGLSDPRTIAFVQACARELEADAALIESGNLTEDGPCQALRS
jgi:hypothetical protein